MSSILEKLVKEPAFTPAMREEIIAALWWICAILAFGFGFNWTGFLFTIKAGLATCYATAFALEEIRQRKTRQKN